MKRTLRRSMSPGTSALQRRFTSPSTTSSYSHDPASRMACGVGTRGHKEMSYIVKWTDCAEARRW